mgnify:CR=1 FL=1
MTKRTVEKSSIVCLRPKAAYCLLATAALLLSQFVIADSKIDSVEPSVRAEMTRLVESWIDAEVLSDARALEEILHEDFLSTFASGTTLDRDSYVDFIVGLDIPPFKVINESMIQHGDTVVVVDVSESGTTKFTWIAMKQGDQWKVVSQTFSSIKSPETE